jgi:hypothetical protein
LKGARTKAALRDRIGTVDGANLDEPQLTQYAQHNSERRRIQLNYERM